MNYGGVEERLNRDFTGRRYVTAINGGGLNGHQKMGDYMEADIIYGFIGIRVSKSKGTMFGVGKMRMKAYV